MKKTKTVLITVGVVALVAVVLAGTFRRYRVAAASDAPTLLPGDLVVANTWAYRLSIPFTHLSLFPTSGPKRGDMVICRLPDSDPGTVYVKRIVGVPGDEINIVENLLHVNGAPLELRDQDRFMYREIEEQGKLGAVVALERDGESERLVTFTPGMAESANYGPFKVEPGHYFLLGDNRDNSRDSRHFGAVPRKDILGKVVMFPKR